MKLLRFLPRLLKPEQENRRRKKKQNYIEKQQEATSLSAFKAESKAIHFHFSTLAPSFKSVSFGYYRRVWVHVFKFKKKKKKSSRSHRNGFSYLLHRIWVGCYVLAFEMANQENKINGNGTRKIQKKNTTCLLQELF